MGSQPGYESMFLGCCTELWWLLRAPRPPSICGAVHINVRLTVLPQLRTVFHFHMKRVHRWPGNNAAQSTRHQTSIIHLPHGPCSVEPVALMYCIPLHLFPFLTKLSSSVVQKNFAASFSHSNGRAEKLLYAPIDSFF